MSKILIVEDEQSIRMALEDDLNTPQAIAKLHDWAGSLNKAEDYDKIHPGFEGKNGEGGDWGEVTSASNC